MPPSDGRYPLVRDTYAHPIVERFFALDHDDIVSTYRRAHPGVCAAELLRLLRWRCEHFFWAGCDFFPLAGPPAGGRLLLLETNSCPAGQKSMPALRDEPEWGGYQRIYDTLFAHLPRGAPLAVIFDKNEQEAQSYAAVFTASTGQRALLIPMGSTRDGDCIRFVDDRLEANDGSGWTALAGALRYVTDNPWLRLPVGGRAPLLNPVSACLAGGRNKHLARIAYQRFNERWQGSALSIRTPVTSSGLSPQEVPGAVMALGGCAIIKTPYSHAGEGVFPIVTAEGLLRWAAETRDDQRFVVQQMIAHEHLCASRAASTRNTIYDVRMLVANGQRGFRPIAGFARTATLPLTAAIHQSSARQQLMTSLSYRDESGAWRTDPSRLIPFNEEHFESLGLELQDLVDAFVQTTMATIAIDQLAITLTGADGSFDFVSFHQLNDDPALRRQLAGRSNHTEPRHTGSPATASPQPPLTHSGARLVV